MRARRGAAIAAAAAVGMGALLGGRLTAASAHGDTSPLVHTVVDGTSVPMPPGVTLKALPRGAAALDVTNRSRTDMEILAPDGVPFLRIGPEGALANFNSLAWYQSGNPGGEAAVPKAARIGGPPRWVRVSRTPHWTWFDHRLHPTAIVISPTLSEGRNVAKLSDWSVPIRLAGRPAAIQGHVEFRPVVGQVRAEVTSGAQPFPGLTVAAISARSPQLSAFATSGAPVTILGRDGEPFARVSPRGTEVNLRSPTYAYDRRSGGVAFRPPPGPALEPRWRRVVNGGVYSWRDPRLLSREPPREVVESPRPTVLDTWSVEMERGGIRRTVRGTTSWKPFAPGSEEGSSATPGWGLLAGLTLALVAAVAVITRLRGRATAGSR